MIKGIVAHLKAGMDGGPGATLYACVQRLREAFPYANVQAFAVFRTLSRVLDITDPVDPVTDGTISLTDHGDRTRRVP